MFANRLLTLPYLFTVASGVVVCVGVGVFGGLFWGFTNRVSSKFLLVYDNLQLMTFARQLWGQWTVSIHYTYMHYN